MIRKHHLPLTLAIALLTGCAWNTLAPESSASTVDLTIRPAFLKGGYQSQAVVEPYTADSVNHLVVTLARMDGNTETPLAEVDLPKADLSKGIAFTKLRHDRTYRIRAHAYKASGTHADDLISTDDQVDLAVGKETEHVLNLEIRLKNRPFNGKAGLPGIDAQDGQYLFDGPASVTVENLP